MSRGEYTTSISAATVERERQRRAAAEQAARAREQAARRASAERQADAVLSSPMGLPAQAPAQERRDELEAQLDGLDGAAVRAARRRVRQATAIQLAEVAATVDEAETEGRRLLSEQLVAERLGRALVAQGWSSDPQVTQALLDGQALRLRRSDDPETVLAVQVDRDSVTLEGPADEACDRIADELSADGVQLRPARERQRAARSRRRNHTHGQAQR